MFEKEAEEYLKKDGTKAEQILNALNEISPIKITLKQFPFILAMLEQTFKDGAEFGYNKALEEATHNYNAIIADYDKRIAELEEENAKLKKEVLEVRQHLELTEREWGKDTTKFILCKTQLTKAKDIIKELVKGIRITFEHRGFITNVDAFLLKAEQFLKEVEK